MAEKVGLIAVLDMKNFNAGFTKYMSSLTKMNKDTTKVATGLTGNFTSLGDSVLKVGGLMAGAFVAGVGAATTAITAFAIEGVKAATSLEQGIADIASVLGISTEEAQVFKDVILDLGLDPELKVTADEAATAIELLARNGVFAGQSLTEMEETARGAGRAVVLLANATGTEFGTAADIATDAMAIFERGLGDVDDTVSSIVAVTTQSKLTIDDFALALRNGGAAAGNMGVSLEEFNAVIAASAEELGNGRKAGTGFRNFLTRLTPNTDKATDAMRELGLITENGSNIFFDATGSLKDMSEIATILNQVLLQERDIISEVGGRTSEQNRVLGELREQYAKATQNILDFESGVKGITLTQDERNEKIAKERELLELLAPKIAELEGIRGDLITTTSALTDEERSMALETIFGADALGTVLALAKEGAPAFESVAEAAEVLGISMDEARAVMDSGATAFDILMQQMDDVDAAEAAATRMDTLAGKMEILEGIIDTVKIQVGDVFIPLLRDLTSALINVADQAGPVVLGFFQTLGDVFTSFIDAIRSGEGPIQGLADAMAVLNVPPATIDNITKLIGGIQSLAQTIGTFVSENADAFIGALSGIGILFGASGLVSGITKIIGLIKLLAASFNPLILIAGIIGAIWNSNFGGIRDIILDALSAVGEFFSGIESLEDLVQRVGDLIGVNLVEDLESLTTFFSEIGGIVGEAFGPIVETVGGILSELGTAFSEGGFVGAIETFKGLWPDITQVAGDALGEAVTVIEEIFGVDLVTPINGFIEFISGVGAQISEKFGQVIESEQFAQIAEAISSNFGPIQEIIEESINNVIEDLRGSGIGVAISNFGESFAGISEVPEKALEGFIGLVDDLFGIDLVEVVTNAADTVEDTFDEIGSAIETALAPVVNIFEAITETLGPTFEETFTNIGSALESFAPLGEQFQELWASIVPIIEGLIIPLFERLASNFSLVRPLLDNLIQNFAILGPVLEIAGKILGGIILTGLALITGLINGLVSAINPLLMALSFLAQLIVTTLSNAFTVLVSLFELIGAAITAIVTGDFTVLQEAWSNLVENFLQATSDFVTNFIGFIVTLGLTVWELISGLVEGVVGFFQNLFDDLVGNSIIPDMVNAILEWILSLKDSFILFIGELVTNVIEAVTTFVTTVIETVSQWVLDLIAKVIELKDSFLLTVSELWTLATEAFNTALTTLLETISTWVLDLIEKAVELKDEILLAIDELWELTSTAFETGITTILEVVSQWVLDIIDQAITLKDDVFQAIEDLWEDIVDTVEDGATEAFDFFSDLVFDVISLFTTDTDWTQLGQAIIDALVETIRNGITAVSGAVQALVDAVIQKAREILGIASPSKVFEEIGESTIEGFRQGWLAGVPGTTDVVIDFVERVSDLTWRAVREIESVLSTLDIEGILNLAGAFESMGSAAVKALKFRLVDPLEDEMDILDDQIDDVLEGVPDRIRRIFEMGPGTLLGAAQAGVFIGVTPQEVRAINQLIALDEERLAIAEQLAEEEERIAAFKEQQQNLAFLEQQLKLLDFIAEQGLEGASILEGLQLGLDADAGAIVTAMTEAMQLAIQAAQDTLQISSPSKVFEDIGENTMLGFVEGLTSTFNQVFGTMQTFTNDMIGAMSPQGVGDTITTTDRSLQLEVNNNFTGEPQITDVSDLEFTLATFIR